MKLAIIGSRGFLTDYGGFETFTKQLVLGLKKKGYEITVYGLNRYRNPEKEKYFAETRRVWVSSIRIKFLEKVSASFLSVIHASFSKNKIILLLGVSAALLSGLPRLMGKRIIINVDGIEWKREKWPKCISFFLHISELLSSVFCHEVIADSKNIAKYIEEKYNRVPIFIPYGAEIGNDKIENDNEILKKYNLKPKAYFLQVCRLEPDNNPHIVAREFMTYKGNKELVIIGDTPHSITYRENLKRLTDERIKFLGAIYGDEYKIILRNAYCYIHGHEAGGTNPVLLEAMASAKYPIVLNVPYNLEVISNCGTSFSKNIGELSNRLETLDKNGSFIEEAGKRALQRVQKFYTWETAISDYDSVFKRVTRAHYC